MVAFAPTEGSSTPHNGGDASGWGTGAQTGNGFNPQGQSIEEAESGPLISQMAALDVSTVDIRLNINNVDNPLIVADETTPKSVLPKIKPGTKVHGSAVIHLQDGTARTAYLDETEAALHGVLKFKVPYNYTANDLSGTQVASGTYFARDGINLAAQTVAPIAGWQCAEDGTTHYGSYVAGVRGDITLNAVLDSGAGLSAVSDKTTLYAKTDATFNDVATITITGGSGAYSVTPDSSSASLVDCTGSGSSWTVSIKNDTTTPNSTGKVMFADNMNATINVTDTMNGGTTSVSITLKNKYSLEAGLTYTDSSGNSANDTFNSSTEFNAGDTLNYSTVSLTAPTGRQIVAYSYTHPTTSTTTIYKTTTTPPDTFTFSSALGRRNVYLSAVLDFTCSRSDGGYGTTASPLNSQTGTSTNPYLLNYYGNDTNKRNQIELEISDNNCADSALTIEPAPAQPAIVNTTFVITHTGNKFLIKINPALAENNVYTSNTIKLTITDPATGAKKDIHVLLKKIKIGNKNAPDTVGDIVFTDGSVMSYSDFAALDAAVQNEKKDDAVAVIFDAASKKGVGLNIISGKVWCSASAQAYNVNTYATSTTDGKANTDQIAALSDYNETNYPAFWYCKTYSVPGFTSDWYLPAKDEAIGFLGTANITNIFTALGKPDPVMYNGNLRYLMTSTTHTGDMRWSADLWGGSTPLKDEAGSSSFVYPMRYFN